MPESTGREDVPEVGGGARSATRRWQSAAENYGADELGAVGRQGQRRGRVAPRRDHGRRLVRSARPWISGPPPAGRTSWAAENTDAASWPHDAVDLGFGRIPPAVLAETWPVNAPITSQPPRRRACEELTVGQPATQSRHLTVVMCSAGSRTVAGMELRAARPGEWPATEVDQHSTQKPLTLPV